MICTRCSWVDKKSEIYITYHDEEWGVPLKDDTYLFEMLLLESFQAGLSWITVLKKREAFRKSFDCFDYHIIANYDSKKIEELMTNKEIIRNKLKINAAVTNAQVFIKIQEEYKTFSNYIWSFTDNKVIKNLDDHFLCQSKLSDLISNDLRKRGMKFVGSVIIYSYLQAIGIINDHETD